MKDQQSYFESKFSVKFAKTVFDDVRRGSVGFA